MPQIFWAANNPTAGHNAQAVPGDIFVATSTLEQRRRNNSGGWDVIVPPDTRGDVVPGSGSILNDRLASVGQGRPWELGWANAAEGVVGPAPLGQHKQTTALAVWTITHNLSAPEGLVAVTVIADNGDVHEPHVEFLNDMICELHFTEPVSGTAIVRR